MILIEHSNTGKCFPIDMNEEDVRTSLPSVFIWGLMSYLRCLCLFGYIGVQRIVFYVLSAYTWALFCRFLLIVHFWMTLRYSLTFIYIYLCFYNNIIEREEAWRLAVPTKRSFLHPQFDLDVLSNQLRASDLSDDLIRCWCL